MVNNKKNRTYHFAFSVCLGLLVTACSEPKNIEESSKTESASSMSDSGKGDQIQIENDDDQFSIDKLKEFTSEQIQAIPLFDLKQFTVEQISALTQEQFISFTPEQISVLLPEHILARDYVDLSYLDSDQYRRISPEVISNFGYSYGSLISHKHFSAFTDEQIAAMTGNFLDGLSCYWSRYKDQVEVSHLTSKQLELVCIFAAENCDATFLKRLTPEQISDLGNEVINKFNTQAFRVLSVEQLVAITDEQKAYMHSEFVDFIEQLIELICSQDPSKFEKFKGRPRKVAICRLLNLDPLTATHARIHRTYLRKALELDRQPERKSEFQELNNVMENYRELYGNTSSEVLF